jgi:hypothetical protein
VATLGAGGSIPGAVLGAALVNSRYLAMGLALAPSQPVLPAHDGGFWGEDDWRNWRRRVWHGEPERTLTRGRTTPGRPGCAPSGTRPRDLRSSFVTLRVYEGVPLTQIAREVGTSVG